MNFDAAINLIQSPIQKKSCYSYRNLVRNLEQELHQIKLKVEQNQIEFVSKRQ